MSVRRHFTALANATRFIAEPLERRMLLSLAPAGPEFRVNTYTTNHQSESAIAMDADGDFVVAWNSSAQDLSGIGIFAQRYDALGVPRGPEFRVNRFTAGDQKNPAVAMDADGDFVVAWQSYDQDGSNWGIFAQRYNAAGLPQGLEFRVNSHVSNEQSMPAVAIDADGDFVVAWQSHLQDGIGSGVYARRYNAAGVPQGAEFRVNSFTPNDQTNPVIGMDADGDFVVAWQSYDQDGSNWGIFAQRYNPAGLPQGAEFRVNSFTTGSQDNSAVAMDLSGDFVVAWHSPQDGSSYGIYAQRYNAAGVAQGSEFRVNSYTTNQQLMPVCAMDAAGDFVIAWHSLGQDGSSYGVYARGYNAAGVAQGGEFKVNTFAIDIQGAPAVAMDHDGDLTVTWQSYAQDDDRYGIYAQRYIESSVEFRVNSFTTGDQRVPSIAMNGDGDFVIAWQSAGQDGSGSGVYAQRYNALGAPLGAEFQVNTFTTGNQDAPAVAMSQAGDFVVAWSSLFQDGSGYGVYAQRYNAAGVPQGAEFRVNSFTTDSQTQPAVAMDGNGNFAVAWESNAQDGSFSGVYVQRYRANGDPQGGEFRANTYTSGFQMSPTLGLDAVGNFVVAWQSDGQDGSSTGIYAQRYNAAAVAQGSEFRVSTFTPGNQDQPSLSMASSGDFVVAWSSPQDGAFQGIYARRYNSTATPQGAEFRVNSFTPDSQHAPAAAINPDGNFVIAWTSLNQDGFANGIYAQAYDAAGGAQGGEFRVNTFTTGNQNIPAIAIDRTGDAVVTWNSYGQDGSGDGVYAQRYTESRFEFRVNSYTPTDQTFPAIAMDADGDFVVAWESLNQDGSGRGIYAQRYNGSGVPQGGEFRVNTYTTDSQAFPAIAMDADGDFVVAWESFGQDGIFNIGIYAQRYNAAGVPQGGEFRVNSVVAEHQDFPAIAMDGDGDFVVTWTSWLQDGEDGGIYAQRYNAAGVPQGGEFRVNTYTTDDQRYPAIAMDADGDFVVAWQSYFQDFFSVGIYAQRYNAAGVPQGGEFRANTYTTNAQDQATVAMDIAGNFVIAWRSVGQDGSEGGVYAQRFNAGGVPQGAEFRVNSFTTDRQFWPAAAMDADGDFVIAWTSRFQVGNSYDIYAQRYNGSGVPGGGEFRVNTYTTSLQEFPSVAMDSDGDFAVTWQSAQDGGARGIYAKRYPAEPAPAVTSSSFNFATLPQRLSFRFDQNVGPSLGLDDIIVQQLPGGPTVTPSAVSFDTATNTATFTFNTAIPDGRYRARLIASGISGPGGALPADHFFDFTFLRGDANGDGRVNLNDFNILAANFGQSPRDFTQGDFDYSGNVNLSDFNILAGRFGATVGPDGAITRRGNERLPGVPASAGPFGTGLIGGGFMDETEDDKKLVA